MKFIITFVHPIPRAVATAKNIAVFLCLLFFSDTSGKTRCRSSRNCLNTIALLGLDNGNDGTVFCRLHALKSNNKMQVKQTIVIHSLNEDKTLPPALQEAINDFFSWHGTIADIDEKLFSSLESAIAGIQIIGLEPKDALDFLFFYKTAKVLFTQLNSFAAQSSELFNN
jgi:hypothetical protein